MSDRARPIAILLTLAAACLDEVAPPERTTSPEPPPLVSFAPPAVAPAPVEARAIPRPITGGLLLPLPHSDGNLVAAVDPDTARVFVVDLDRSAIVRTLQLPADAAPRRLTQLPDGRIAIALARDAIALVHPDRGEVDRVPTCALPRGIDYDRARERLLVACREGLLVEVPLAGGRATRSVPLPRDLRDVVVTDEGVFVTRFKAAEVLVMDADLRLLRTVSLADRPALRAVDAVAVAYRAVAAPQGGVYVLHQLEHTRLDATTNGGPSGFGDPTPPAPPSGRYGGDTDVVCGNSVVSPTLTRVGFDGRMDVNPGIALGTLMVDLAVGGGRVVVADAGSRGGSLAAPVRGFSEWLLSVGGDDCEGTMRGEEVIDVGGPSGPVTSVAFDRRGEVVALMTAPLTVVGGGARTLLAPTGPEVHGYRIFHQDAGRGIACASCHPEGEDDGQVWHVPRARRTPALGGGLAATAPFHWSGDLPDLRALFDEVLTRRMGGPTLTDVGMRSLAAWLETIPRIEAPPAVDLAAASRGAVTYAARCASCHATPSAASLDVGTGEPLQPPPLRGLMFRAPYMHDGCASTLADRFGRCASPAHGAEVEPESVADLITYLETL